MDPLNTLVNASQFIEGNAGVVRKSIRVPALRVVVDKEIENDEWKIYEDQITKEQEEKFAESLEGNLCPILESG
jgi:hypothetical protein